MGDWIRTQDLLVLHILTANRWQRPVYFAVTVSPESQLNMEQYLRTDGLNYKIVTVPGNNQISAERLHETLFNKFQYRNLDNPDVYYDSNAKGIIQNYRIAFLRLAQHYINERDKEKTIQVLDKMNTTIPEHVIPMADRRVALHISDLYRQAGKKNEFEQRVIKITKNYPAFAHAHRLLLEFYLHENRNAEFEQHAVPLVEKHPEFNDIFSLLLRYYQQQFRYSEAADLLENWITLNPDNIQFSELVKEFREKAAKLKSDTAQVSDSSISR